MRQFGKDQHIFSLHIYTCELTPKTFVCLFAGGNHLTEFQVK